MASGVASRQAPRSGGPGAAPVASVVIITYNGRDRIGAALESVMAQDLGEPYEVIVVASGRDGCADLVRARYPVVRVVRCRHRLNPGQARNRGVSATRGRYVSFLADDCVLGSDWLRRRVARHRQGFAAVGGAVTNGTRRHPLGTASYYLEYSAIMPFGRLLAAQPIPHSLSYERSLLERLGPFPEAAETGEDTVLNRRCLEAGVEIGFDPRIQLAHRNPTRLGPYLRHQYAHGRGLVQCVGSYRLASVVGSIEQPVAGALVRIFVRNPAARWWKVTRRVAREKPRSLPGYLALGPLVWAGLGARALGAWAEWRSLRRD